MKPTESTTEEEASTDNPVLQTRAASQASHETIPSGVDLEAVKAKMAAGLTKEQAVQVLLAQAEHDKAVAEAAAN
jgi:hypothetical protein